MNRADLAGPLVNDQLVVNDKMGPVSDSTAARGRPAPDRSPPAPHIPEALRVAAVDTERHVSRAGWDQSPRMFALVPNALLAEREPSMSEQLDTADPAGFTAVEQEGLPTTSDIESMLARVAWPAEVAGVALAIERIVVPPEAERDLPADAEAAATALMEHPDRQDVRILAAVIRDGSSICLLRQRQHDSDAHVALGADIAPGLVHALSTTLLGDETSPVSD
ncbi:MAG: PPA1309 family protein [Ornithinimicrobium sp.]